MKDILKSLAKLYLILSVVASILIPMVFGNTVSRFGRTERDWPLTIGIFVGIFLSSIIIPIILFGMSEILERVLYICDGIADLKLDQKEIMRKEKEKEEFWKCPNCGALNSPVTGTCSCGYNKTS